MLIILLLILWNNDYRLEPSYEQLATDHFFETIFELKYGSYKTIEFDNHTDTSIYVGNIYGCRKWTDGMPGELVAKTSKQTSELKTAKTGVSIKKTRNSNRLKLFIGSRIQIGDFYLVQVDVYKPYEFVDHYLIKFDIDGKIIEKCEFSEII
jgi:hypothetical protein